MIIEFVDKETPIGGRSSIQLIAEKGKETFYEKLAFKIIPHEFCGSGMRKDLKRYEFAYCSVILGDNRTTRG